MSDHDFDRWRQKFVAGTPENAELLEWFTGLGEAPPPEKQPCPEFDAAIQRIRSRIKNHRHWSEDE